MDWLPLIIDEVRDGSRDARLGASKSTTVSDDATWTIIRGDKEDKLLLTDDVRDGIRWRGGGPSIMSTDLVSVNDEFENMIV